MASTSRFKTSSPQSIPLATSTSASSLGKGKRKVDEVDGEGEDILNGPVEQQQRRNMHRATFADEPRKYRTSTSSHTTSNARRKRARLSSGTSFPTNQTVSEHGVRAPSRAGSHRRHAPYAASSASRGSHTPPQSSVKAGSVSSHQQHSVRYAGQPQRARHPSSTRASSKRGSVSQASIPISALISPHAPSISLRPSTAYHMRDPRKPPPVHPTPWSLSFPSADWIEGGGSPIHAWLFFLGFVLFPAWWIAGLFIAVPKTRTLGGDSGPEEKSVVLDDPQVEHDAKSWRKRCRVMAAISLFTYVPFIVLVVIFVPRS
ncbi:hypothetical protein F5050DRAFT_1566412 [Lentinula boryana]|uniref:Serine-rich protein n=1 Tax=Lentinula boryana TaxID=40481 RepID=A0ABQ8QK49_9AGAR|nr:hypothetical protein F5050DRAFT_1566412 [Lentinula boryana]